MKTKTRVLAMLLTVLMVVGILPLSLFALDSVEPLDVNASTNPGAYEERSLDDIKTEFAKQNVALGMYMSFGKFAPDDYVAKRAAAKTSWQVYVGGTENADLFEYVDGGTKIGICDHKKSVSIVDGALYFGNTLGKKADGYNLAYKEGETTKYKDESECPPDKTPYIGNQETYLQLNAFPGSSSIAETYISIDVKMNGDKMSVPDSGHFFTIVWRGTGPNFIHALGVNAEGELSIAGEQVGQLSKTEYTRLTLVISRTDNKYFVYVNDVIVNIGGTQLLTQADADRYNAEKNPTDKVNINTMPIECVRAYIINNNYDADGVHDGVFLDNIVIGKKITTTENKTTTPNEYIKSDFSNAVSGDPVKPYTNAFGTYNANKLKDGVLDARAVIYFDEDGDGKVDYIKCQKAPNLEGKCTVCNKNSCECDQVYVHICSGIEAVSLSLDLEMGSAAIKGSDSFIWMRYKSTEGEAWAEANKKWNEEKQQWEKPDSRRTRNVIDIDSDGTVKADGGIVIGKLSTDGFVNVKVEFIPYGELGFAYVYYVDGVLKHINYYAENIIEHQGFRIYNLYNNNTGGLAEDDIHMKNIVYNAINKYDNDTETITSFGKMPFGFITKNGITRYYDGKGGYMTDDFFIGSTKYMVGKDGEILNKISGVLPQRSLDEIKTAFSEQNIDLRFYQTFTNWAYADGRNSFYSEKAVADEAQLSIPVRPLRKNYANDDKYNEAVAKYNADVVEFNALLKEKGLLSTAENSVLWLGVNKQTITTGAEYSYVYGDRNIGIKNFRNAYSVVDDNGNKALFMNYAGKTAVYSSDGNKDGDADALANDDNFVDFSHGLPQTYSSQSGNASHDLFMSVDVKMEDVNILNGFLFTFVYRVNNGGASQYPLVSLTDVGGIYVGRIPTYKDGKINGFKIDASPENLVGFLSQDEYTRIALATDRANNKLYVYINDVLVTPTGVTLFDSFVVQHMNDGNATGNGITYTANTLPVCEVRMYTNTGHNNNDDQKGIYMDNFLFGSRVAVTSATNTVKANALSFNGVTVDNPDQIKGQPGSVIEKVGGIAGSIGENETTGESVVRYVDEDGDGKADAIEWHKMLAADITNKGGGYIDITNPNAATKGMNLRFSISAKGGQDGQLGATLNGDGAFIMIRSTKLPGDGWRRYSQEIWVTLASDGTLKAQGAAVIGKLTNDKYTEITIDIVCNAVTGNACFAAYYVDGMLKAVHQFVPAYSSTHGATGFQPDYARIYCKYNDFDNNTNFATESLAERDVRVNALSFGSTNDYDTLTRMNPFEQKLEGLYGIGGIVRYYNGDGTFKTEDFEINGEKYLVAGGGAVIGPESKGVEFASFAPYVDWDHEGPYLKATTSLTVDNSPINSADRDARVYNALIKGETVELYTSYFDGDKNALTNDHSSYVNINLGTLKNTSVTLDFDMMLSQDFVEDNSSDQAFVYIDGKKNADGSGDRTKHDFADLYMSGDGWLIYKGQKICKLSQKEFTRFSFVMHAPQLDSNNNITAIHSLDIYVNGVLVLKELAGSANAKCITQVRFLKMSNVDFSVYCKDMYIYTAEKPQQFYTMEGGEAILTYDASKEAATPADLKQGFVKENGVLRYYDEQGRPLVNATANVGGVSITADKNGVVPLPCVGDNHLGMTDKGECSICGQKQDGVSSLYGNSLILGSDVKVVFYLDILADQAKAVEIGIAGRDVKNYALGELETVTVGNRTYYKVEYAVSGKDICTDVTVKVVKADDTYAANSYTYSAAQYAADVNALETNDVYTEELKELANALVVYGRNAAAVLVGNVEVDPIGEVDFSDVTVENVEGDDEVVTLNKISLELKSNIKLKIYFNIDLAGFEEESEYTPEMYVVKYGDRVINVADLKKDEELSTETVYVYVAEFEIVAKDLATAYEFSIKDPSDTGIAATFSALYYAKVVVSSDKAEEDAKNLAKAIKLYADAAAKYAASIAEEDSRPIA